MKKIIHRAETRGGADHGWLLTRHTFSFANYYDPQRMHFGVLRVLNDDKVAPGEGFGIHPHDDMEIVSIPLSGTLEHRDSMGNVSIISKGEVQVMSAGTGILHSEYNRSNSEDVRFLQIWVIPRERDLEPRYGQIKIKHPGKNSIETIVTPDNEQREGAVWMHQDAWFSLANVAKGGSVEYKLHKKGHGVYIFVLEGDIEAGGEKLYRRDGMGVYETDSFTMTGEKDAEVLLMEVPMK